MELWHTCIYTHIYKRDQRVQRAWRNQEHSFTQRSYQPVVSTTPGLVEGLGHNRVLRFPYLFTVNQYSGYRRHRLSYFVVLPQRAPLASLWPLRAPTWTTPSSITCRSAIFLHLPLEEPSSWFSFLSSFLFFFVFVRYPLYLIITVSFCFFEFVSMFWLFFDSGSISVHQFCSIFPIFFLIFSGAFFYTYEHVVDYLPQAQQNQPSTKQQSKHVPIRARQHKHADRVGGSQHVVEHLQLAVFSKRAVK